ncbi:hypothetical protein ABFS82_13G077200 [Erythranthe guttata]
MEATIDRLSDLPDSVLTHILSFLPTKFSVRTSILGQRWRHLWTYVPNLDFDCSDQTIIDEVLSTHKFQSINTFRLSSNSPKRTDPWIISTWINIAIDRNIRKLDLCFFDYTICLPNRLFTCKTLVDLRLDSCGRIPDPGIAVRLPRLKKLHLVYVHYKDGESLANLVSRCPVLEELVIYLDMINYRYYRISSPTIKRLSMKIHPRGTYYDPNSDKEQEEENHKMEIDTPALVYLHLVDYAARLIKTGPLTSLTEADIYLCNYVVADHYSLYARSVAGFIDGLHNVKCLNLDLSYSKEIIDSISSVWSTRRRFHNLTKLELTSPYLLLNMFIQNADNLQVLIFSKPFEVIDSWMEPPQQVPECLLRNLRIVKLDQIEGQDDEFEYIRYILRNARVLERMEITYHCSFDSEANIRTLKEILHSYRGSAACEAAFVKGLNNPENKNIIFFR